MVEDESGLEQESKAVLSILVKEVEDILDSHEPARAKEEVEELLNTWKDANDLPVDHVKTLHVDSDGGLQSQPIEEGGSE